MSLFELSQMVVNGMIVSKYDHIATVYIDGSHYFNVFRRYNSDYNFMIQDYNGDIYLHQDFIVRDSINTILCLDSNMYTLEATSYLHNGPIPSLEIVHMRWSEIHRRYQTIHVNVGGVFPVPDNHIIDVKIESEDSFTILRNGRRVSKS